MSSNAVAEPANEELSALIDSKFREYREGTIVNGTILEIRPQVVLVDIGYKSEGAIPTSEFEDEEIEVGDEIEILLEKLEDGVLDFLLGDQVAVTDQHHRLVGWTARGRPGLGYSCAALRCAAP